MRLNRLMLLTILGVAVLLNGCDNGASEAKKIDNSVKKVEKEAKKEKEEKKVIYNKNESIVHEVFQDSAKIGPNGKFMLMVFGTNSDPYTNRLKADIKNSEELAKKIKNDFSSYYLKAHDNLRHKLFHEGEFMDVDTKTMINIYGITSTPTLIFADKKGKAVIVVPGYMPTKQFISTMKFMESNKWQNRDRKNGEVYETLREFYMQNGIDVTKRSK